jgi:hypothetical protein
MSATQRTRQNSLWLYPGELFIRGVHRRSSPSGRQLPARSVSGAPDRGSSSRRDCRHHSHAARERTERPRSRRHRSAPLWTEGSPRPAPARTFSGQRSRGTRLCRCRGGWRSACKWRRRLPAAIGSHTERRVDGVARFEGSRTVPTCALSWSSFRRGPLRFNLVQQTLVVRR